jgi:hypothetical protein
MKLRTSVLIFTIAALSSDHATTVACQPAPEPTWLAEGDRLAQRFGQLVDTIGTEGLGQSFQRLKELWVLVRDIEVCTTKGDDAKTEKYGYAYRVAYLHFLLCAGVNAEVGSDRVSGIELYGVEHDRAAPHMGVRWEYFHALLDRMGEVDAMEQICVTERLALGHYKWICSAWGNRKRGSAP